MRWIIAAMLLQIIVVALIMAVLVSIAQDAPRQWPTPDVAGYCYPYGNSRC